MKRKIFTVLLVFFAFLLSGEETIKLSLRDAIYMALKGNLELKVEKLNYQISEEALNIEEGIYIPKITFSLDKTSNRRPASSVLEGAEISSTDTYSITSSLKEKLITGGEFNLSLNYSRTETNSRFYGLNPSYASQLRFTLNQPLLKNFGKKATERGIIIQANAKETSYNNLYNKTLEIIYRVEEAYWNLVQARMNLEVKKESLNLAKELYNFNKKQVEVGKLAPIELLVSKSEVATRESEVIQAENEIKVYEDALKELLSIKKYSIDWEYRIIPEDKPELKIDYPIPPLDEALKIAKENNPTLKSSLVNLSTKKALMSIAKNQTLPSLNLQLEGWTTGLSGDRVLYEGGDVFFGQIIGVIKGEPEEAVKDALRAIYKNWRIYLTLEIPLSRKVEVSNYKKAKYEYEQALLQVELTKQQIVKEIKNALRSIENARKMLSATKIAMELAKEKLRGEEKKLKMGLTTNYQVLQFQRDFTDRKLQYVKAIINLNISYLKLKKALGTILTENNIKFSFSNNP